jgi:hypothetical protein
VTITAPGSPDRLDAVLARWADSVRLPAAVAVDMLTEILATPAPRIPRPRVVPVMGLSGSWWRGYSADLAATLVTSTRPRLVAA